MRFALRHEWPTDSKGAIALQNTLHSEIVLEDRLDPVHRVAGIDVGFEQDGQVTRAAVAVLNFPDLTLQEWAIARRPTTFPYIPGLLSFREIPAVLDALEQIAHLPQIILCDGQGIAHPRRFGIACHVGVLTGLPTIGVAKSRLIGTYTEPAIEKGAWEPLYHSGNTIGAVLRTRRNTKPLYISPGHRISLPTALAYVQRCTTKYRLPETTRFAHRLASGPPLPETRSEV